MPRSSQLVTVLKYADLRRIALYASLACAAITGVVWILSICTLLEWRPRSDVWIGIGKGHVEYERQDPSYGPPLGWDHKRQDVWHTHWPAFFDTGSTQSLGSHVAFLCVPTLVISGLLARIRSRCSETTKCATCGYDIRGLEVCPECGTAMKA